MASGGGGAIVLVGSMDATHAYHGRSSAAAAMSGLLGLVRALGVELASVGVRANAVLVGPMSRDDVAGSAAPLAIGDAERIERTLLRSPIHRFVTPAEVAAAIGFVAGRGSAFMTGQTLRVDGGWASLNQAPDGMKFR
jgi:NAD(P)-dependent dehydrogenase (short-subunit alcohol dehydrogenase family)